MIHGKFFSFVMTHFLIYLHTTPKGTHGVCMQFPTKYILTTLLYSNIIKVMIMTYFKDIIG